MIVDRLVTYQQSNYRPNLPEYSDTTKKGPYAHFCQVVYWWEKYFYINTVLCIEDIFQLNSQWWGSVMGIAGNSLFFDLSVMRAMVKAVFLSYFKTSVQWLLLAVLSYTAKSRAAHLSQYTFHMDVQHLTLIFQAGGNRYIQNHKPVQIKFGLLVMWYNASKTIHQGEKHE